MPDLQETNYPETLLIHSAEIRTPGLGGCSLTPLRMNPKSEGSGYIFSAREEDQKMFLFDTAAMETRPCFSFYETSESNSLRA